MRWKQSSALQRPKRGSDPSTTVVVDHSLQIRGPHVPPPPARFWSAPLHLHRCAPNLAPPPSRFPPPLPLSFLPPLLPEKALGSLSKAFSPNLPPSSPTFHLPQPPIALSFPPPPPPRARAPRRDRSIDRPLLSSRGRTRGRIGCARGGPGRQRACVRGWRATRWARRGGGGETGGLARDGCVIGAARRLLGGRSVRLSFSSLAGGGGGGGGQGWWWWPPRGGREGARR